MNQRNTTTQGLHIEVPQGLFHPCPSFKKASEISTRKVTRVQDRPRWPNRTMRDLTMVLTRWKEVTAETRTCQTRTCRIWWHAQQRSGWQPHGTRGPVNVNGVACRVGQLWKNTPFWIILYLVTCNNEHDLVCTKTRQNVDQVYDYTDPSDGFKSAQTHFELHERGLFLQYDRYTKPTAAKLYWDSPRRTACWQTIALE